MSYRLRSAVRAALAALLVVSAPALADTTVTFDSGAEGWIGPAGPGGSTVIEPTGGNPGANMHTVFSNFGINFRNTSNAEFVGDYTSSVSVTLSIDVKVEEIDFFGSPVPRPWLVDLRDYDSPEPGYPYTSVWYKFADIAEASHSSWTNFTVTITDTSEVDLPPGWGGTGAEDALANPILPPGRTFTDVLAGVDEIAFTTYEPGFVFAETLFDLRIDNVAIFQQGTPPGPGEAPSLVVGKSTTTPDDLELSWQASCLAGAQTYGIYEGELGTWYDHARIDCSDAGGDLTETVTPDAASSYYLVVPLGATSEGVYGYASDGTPRPTGISRCRSTQNDEACP